jgi:hypothetical protein
MLTPSRHLIPPPVIPWCVFAHLFHWLVILTCVSRHINIWYLSHIIRCVNHKLSRISLLRNTWFQMSYQNVYYGWFVYKSYRKMQQVLWRIWSQHSWILTQKILLFAHIVVMSPFIYHVFAHDAQLHYVYHSIAFVLSVTNHNVSNCDQHICYCRSVTTFQTRKDPGKNRSLVPIDVRGN